MTTREELAAKAIQTQLRKKLTLRSTQRQQITLELQHTERSYVENLRNLLNNYIIPLRNPPSPSEAILKVEKVKELFAGIDPVLHHHEEILNQLTIKLKNWTPNISISDVFEDVAEKVGKAYSLFTKNFSKAIIFLQYHEQRNSRFRAFLEMKKMESGSRYVLQDLLIMPIQRFPHYILLLQRLSKVTPENHNDYVPLKKAQESVKKIAMLINEKQSEADNLKKLSELEERMSGTCPPLVIENRKFVKELNVTMIVNGLRELRKLFLFSDSLLCVERGSNFFQKNIQYEFNWMYPLNQISFEPLQEKVYGENYQNPGSVLTHLTDYYLSVKKETLKKNALAHLNKQTTGILILIQNAKEIKKRYIIAVDDEDVRESFLKDVNILMKNPFDHEKHLPGVIKIFNGNSIDTESAYKSFYVRGETTSLEVIDLALKRNNKLSESADNYIIVLQENGEVKRELLPNDLPLVLVSNEFNDKKDLKLVLHHKDYKNLKPKVQETISKIKIHCDGSIIRNGEPGESNFETKDNPTVSELLQKAIVKYGLEPKSNYFLYLYCQETGALRKLRSHENIITARDEVMMQNMIRKGGSAHVNIKCLLKEHPNEKPKIFPIRVYADKAFPGESYKSIPATAISTARDILESILKKFKDILQGLTVDDLVLFQLTENGEETLVYHDEILPTKTKDFLFQRKNIGNVDKIENEVPQNNNGNEGVVNAELIEKIKMELLEVQPENESLQEHAPDELEKDNLIQSFSSDKNKDDVRFLSLFDVENELFDIENELSIIEAKLSIIDAR